MIAVASSGLASIQSSVAYQASTSFWTSSGRSVDDVGVTTRWSGMVPGKSAELNSTFEPGRSSACRVNGANTPTQSNSPPAKPAAAASVGRPGKSMSSSVMPDRVEALQQQEVVDDAGLGGDRLARPGPRSS